MACSIETRRSTLGAVLLACGMVAFPSPCHAQAPTRQGAAQTLFDEARTLFDRGAFDAACDKFKSSHELDPKGGTLLNLALCRQKQGRLASAWTAFAEARNLSLKEGREERVAFADTKLRELEGRVPRIRVVVVGGARLAGLEVRIDGEAISPVVWNIEFPIDPGAHRLDASAPGYVSFTSSIVASLGKPGEVTVPVLARASEPEPAKPQPQPSLAAATSRWPGWTVAGIGVASIGVGAAFGVRAFNQRKEAESLCAASRCDEGQAINDDGVRSAWISNIAVGAGLLAVAAGIVLLVLPSRSAVSTVQANTFTF